MNNHFKGVEITSQHNSPDRHYASSQDTATLADTVRWVAGLGMFALDRPISISCVHATDFCRAHCYNHKMMVPNGREINAKDIKNEEAWQAIDSQAAQDLAASMARKRRQTTRARFMTRGEALSTLDDVERIAAVLKATPATTWWLPTRSWRDEDLFAVVLARLGGYKNLRILASMDPSNSQEDWDHVVGLGLSTMYFDDNTRPGTAPTGERWFKCPKTHRGIKGHCSTCKAGCFTTRRRVDVHLLQH